MPFLQTSLASKMALAQATGALLVMPAVWLPAIGPGFQVN